MRKLAIQTGRRGRHGGARPAIHRPPRPSALNGAAVGVVLDAMGASVRRLNDYLVLLHISAGLAMLAFSVDDILRGGPARPLIIPILGAYMSASVVFYTVLKDRNPTLLVWINGLSDVVFLVAAQRLAFLNLAGLGSDPTVALLILIVSFLYGTAGHSRLSVAIAAISTAFFCFTILSPTTGYPVLDARSVASLAIVIAAAVGGVYIARAVRRGELARSIRRLERLEVAVAVHRLRAAATPSTPR